MPEEHAGTVEDADTELALEIAQGAEHPVDRATRRFSLPVDGDHEEGSFDEIAACVDRTSVRGPVREETIDGGQEMGRFLLVESGRDPEDPGLRVIGE